MWVSWKHQSSDYAGPLTFEQKVEIFYEQTLGWQLHIANLIANGGATFEAPQGRPAYEVASVEHSGFAVLQICLSYFELVGSLVAPSKKQYGDRFKAGVREVLPSLFKGSADDEALLKRLYKGARCGLYHLGRTGSRVGLGQPLDGSSMEYDPTTRTLSVSPQRLPVVLKTHLDSFKVQLLDPTNATLRQEFEKQFDRGFG
jgi:hypothetical protein